MSSRFRLNLCAAVLFSLLVAGPLQTPPAYACMLRVSLPAIENAMVRPDIDSARLQKAKDIKAKATTAIQEGRAAEGNQHYYALMRLLGLQTSSGKSRC